MSGTTQLNKSKMKGKKFFDVIFSSKHFSTSKLNVEDLLNKQEKRDPHQEKKILDAIENLRFKIESKFTKKSSLKTTFGFNITSSINFVLNILPKTVITTTSEFPPIIHMLNKMSGIPLAYFNLSNSDDDKIIELNKSTPEREVVLLISHVSYFDGLNILNVLLDNQECLKYLSQFKLHLIIDGAHAIGNIHTIENIELLKEEFSKKIKLSSFTYIFDCYKWLRGLWGLSVVISDSQQIIDTHSFIYPNTKWNKETWGFTFSQPYSASFNPNLIFWFLNANILQKAIPTLAKQIKENTNLTNNFLSGLKNETWRGSAILGKNTRHQTNMLSLKVPLAQHLCQYLSKNKIYSHLIGEKNLKIIKKNYHYPAVTRLCFSSNLIKREDIKELLKTLSKYDKFSK